MAWLLLFAAVAANIFANLMFKTAMAAAPQTLGVDSLFRFAFNPYLWAGGLSAAMVLGFYLLAIRDSGLSSSYAFVTCLSLVGITLASSLIFREALSLQSIAGVVLVIAGIFLISSAASSSATAASGPAITQPAE